MKSETGILKAAVIFIGIIALGLSIFWLPGLILRTVHTNFNMFMVVMAICLSVIPFFIALYQAFSILRYIDKNQAFSKLSEIALKNIKLCAMIVCGLYIASLPFLYFYADKEDAPGIILVGLFLVFVSFIISVFAAVLQKLLKAVIEIKAENDMTV